MWSISGFEFEKRMNICTIPYSFASHAAQDLIFSENIPHYLVISWYYTPFNLTARCLAIRWWSLEQVIIVIKGSPYSVHRGKRKYYLDGFFFLFAPEMDRSWFKSTSLRFPVSDQRTVAPFIPSRIKWCWWHQSDSWWWHLLEKVFLCCFLAFERE